MSVIPLIHATIKQSYACHTDPNPNEPPGASTDCFAIQEIN